MGESTHARTHTHSNTHPGSGGVSALVSSPHNFVTAAMIEGDLSVALSLVRSRYWKLPLSLFSVRSCIIFMSVYEWLASVAQCIGEEIGVAAGVVCGVDAKEKKKADTLSPVSLARAVFAPMGNVLERAQRERKSYAALSTAGLNESWVCR